MWYPWANKPEATGNRGAQLCPGGWLVGAVLLGSGCDQLIVTWQGGSWGALNTLSSPSSCLYARASCWGDTGRRQRAGGPWLQSVGAPLQCGAPMRVVRAA